MSDTTHVIEVQDGRRQRLHPGGGRGNGEHGCGQDEVKDLTNANNHAIQYLLLHLHAVILGPGLVDLGVYFSQLNRFFGAHLKVSHCFGEPREASASVSEMDG